MWTPSSRATAFSLARPSSVVSRSPSSRSTTWVDSSGLAVLVDVGGGDGMDLRAEAILVPGLGGPLLGQQTELVGVLAGDAPLLGDPLGALELGRVLVLLEVRLGDRLAHVLLAGEVGAHGHPAHDLDAARHGDVDHARRRRGWWPGWWPAGTSRTGCRRWWPRWRWGRPMASQAVRVTLNACCPTWLTQPPTTCPTSAGSMPERSISSAARSPSRSAECMPDSPPPRRPTGDRTASMMTISLEDSALMPAA